MINCGICQKNISESLCQICKKIIPDCKECLIQIYQTRERFIIYRSDEYLYPKDMAELRCLRERIENLEKEGSIPDRCLKC
jgi:hypothetical protein